MPVTVIGDRAIAEFRPNEILEALKPGSKVAVRDPSETIRVLDKALVAVERAMRQMPEDKLEWAIPMRKRPMRELAVNIYWHALTAIEERAAADAAIARVESKAGFEEIADWGHGVLLEFRRWAKRQDMDALRKPAGAKSKERSGAEKLDLAAGQVVHHLRQLYNILEGFGITPEKKAADSEWPPEYVLSILW